VEWLRRLIRKILGVEDRLLFLESVWSNIERERSELLADLDEMRSLNKQLGEDSQLNNKAISLLRGLTLDIDPVIKRTKTVKIEMRKRCEDLEARVSKLEEKNG